MRIKAAPIRVSPTELLLLNSVYKSLLIECEGVEECDDIYTQLREGRPRPELAAKLASLGLIEGERRGCIKVAGEGVLKERLERLINPCDNPVATAYVYDGWRHRLFLEISRRAEQSGERHLFVFNILDLGVVGPYVVPGKTPNYLCAAQQLAASSNWVLRVVRDSGGTALDEVRLNFLASFAALVMEKIVENEELLSGRLVLIDFTNIYIDVIKIYRNPSCVQAPYDLS